MENSNPQSASRRDRWIALFLFILIILTQFNARAAHSGDTRWYIPTALSLLHEGNTDLDEYRGMITPRDYGIRRHDGHLYNFFPIGPALVALPFVAILDQIASCLFGQDLYALAAKEYPWRIESAVAVCIAALATVALFLLCRLYLDRWPSLLLALIFAYGTSTWSTASQSLWQHGPSMLMLTLTLHFLLRAEQDKRWVYWAAVPLFFSYTIRPTNAATVALFSLYVLMRYRQQFPAFLGIGVASLIPLFADCYTKSGRLLDQYYLAKNTLVRLSPKGLLGTLISPGRGLFIYSSIFLFSGVGLIAKVRRKKFQGIDLCLLVNFVVHWISLSLFAVNWWGGHSVGPRYFTDLNPFFTFYLIPLFERPWNWNKIAQGGLFALFGLTALLSGFIHWRCATHWEVLLWNSQPIDINLAPQRLWDWGDVPFLRGIQVVNPNVAPVARASLLFAPNKMNAHFGEMIALRGYDLKAGSLSEGFSGRVTLRLYWQALRPPDFDYSIFVHMVDAAGNLISQSDHAPGAVANYPPTRWRKGQVVVDEHIIFTPREMAGGSYTISVGVYNWSTGERLLLPKGQGDAIRLEPTIEVLPRLPYAIYIPLMTKLARP